MLFYKAVKILYWSYVVAYWNCCKNYTSFLETILNQYCRLVKTTKKTVSPGCQDTIFDLNLSLVKLAETILNWFCSLLKLTEKKYSPGFHNTIFDLYLSLVKLTVKNSFNKLSRYKIRFVISLVKISYDRLPQCNIESFLQPTKTDWKKKFRQAASKQ